MAIMTHVMFHFNWVMLTLIFGIRASQPPTPPQTTEKAGPDGVEEISTTLRTFIGVETAALIPHSDQNFLKVGKISLDL